ncbi:stonustoxin subunit beta isoform X2 [Danio rerio]|uniref:Stonustoxin subunit beta isoform X2 n=1 Tax=Danio rerio TaxID=7955 RepID=A0AC58IH90_DANRE
MLSFELLKNIWYNACNITLDPNTAHEMLSVAEDNKTLVRNSEPMIYPDHPDRFTGLPQILCKERLSGRCYWEAEWKGLGDMVVSYGGIGRKGESLDCRFGANDKSWILSCFIGEKLIAWHDNMGVYIPLPTTPYNRIGVFLDEPAGILSVFSVPDENTLNHLYTFKTKFTEPLYAGFVLYTESVAPFTHTDLSGKLPAIFWKGCMCEQVLFENTGNFVLAIFWKEKL